MKTQIYSTFLELKNLLRSQNQFIHPFKLEFHNEDEEALYMNETKRFEHLAIKVFNLILILSLISDFIIGSTSALSRNLVWILVVTKISWILFNSLLIHFYENDLISNFSSWFVIVMIYGYYGIFFSFFNIGKHELGLILTLLGLKIFSAYHKRWYLSVFFVVGVLVFDRHLFEIDNVSIVMILAFYIISRYWLSRVKRLIYHSIYQSLEELENFKSIITEHVDIGVFVIKKSNFEVIYQNKRKKEISEKTKEDLDGKILSELSGDENLMEERRSSIMQFDENGETKFYIVTISRFVYRKILSFIITLADVTAFKKLQAKLESFLENKDSMIASVSHDIRTPINCSMAMNEVALSEIKDQNVKTKLLISQKSLNLLLFMLMDILEFYKSRKSSILVQKSKFKLHQIINEILELYFFMIESRGLQLNIDLRINPNLQIESDEMKVKRILINLISNALKFTLRGSITLRFEVIEINFESFLKISVIDTGIGIKEENLKLILEKFGQLEHQEEGSMPNREILHGIGLGLTISQQMQELLLPNSPLNKLEVRSVFGEGSAFSFFLQVQNVPFPMVWNYFPLRDILQYMNCYMEPEFSNCLQNFKEMKGLSKDCSDDKFVIIVEDEETNIMVLLTYLQEAKIKIEVCRNGQEAVFLFQNAISNGKQVPLVLMDLNMPVMNGVEATKEIRKLESHYRSQASFIVCLSANVSPLTDEEMDDIGFNFFEFKPVSKSKILHFFERYT